MNDHQKRAAPGARPGLSKERMEQDFPAAENSPSGLETQARAACRDCSFYRVVPLDSGRVRTVCMFHGTKNPVEPCHGFQAGNWSEVWADPTDTPKQSFLCRACAHGIVPHIRAALRGLVGCMAGHIVDGAAYPVPCRDFTARGVRHAA